MLLRLLGAGSHVDDRLRNENPIEVKRFVRDR